MGQENHLNIGSEKLDTHQNVNFTAEQNVICMHAELRPHLHCTTESYKPDAGLASCT